MTNTLGGNVIRQMKVLKHSEINMRGIMKRKIFLLASSVLMFAATGCVSHYRDAGADYLSRPKDFSRLPYYTEYNVSQTKVSGQGQSSVFFWLFQSTDGKYCQLGDAPDLSIFSQIAEVFSPTRRAIFNAKSSALYQACESSTADHILGATFEYKITDYFFWAHVECSVKGYPATVKRVKMLDLNDKQPVILNNWQKIEYIEPYGRKPEVYSDQNLSGIDSVPQKKFGIL